MGITLNPISLLAEFMDNGSLEKYLEKNPSVGLVQKVKWMHQIAAGMLHLHVSLVFCCFEFFLF
jgi:hypothetical protein